MQLNKEEYIEFSREHLAYEIGMLYSHADLLQTSAYYNGNPVVFVSVKNALIEAFIVHARNVLDFLYCKKNHKNNATAHDYFLQVSDWDTLLPVKSDLLKKVHDRGHPEAVHLSYERLKVNPAEKGWDVDKIKGEIKVIVDLFTISANAGRLHPLVYELINRPLVR